jgi:hypothetical protein
MMTRPAPNSSSPRTRWACLYQIDNLPTTVLIDRGGIVRYVYRDFGPRDEAHYLSQLRELLNE